MITPGSASWGMKAPNSRAALRLIVARESQLIMVNFIVVKHHHILCQLEVPPVVLPVHGLVARAGGLGVKVNRELRGLRPFLAPGVGEGMEL